MQVVELKYSFIRIEFLGLLSPKFKVFVIELDSLLFRITCVFDGILILKFILKKLSLCRFLTRKWLFLVSLIALNLLFVAHMIEIDFSSKRQNLSL